MKTKGSIFKDKCLRQRHHGNIKLQCAVVFTTWTKGLIDVLGGDGDLWSGSDYTNTTEIYVIKNILYYCHFKSSTINTYTFFLHKKQNVYIDTLLFFDDPFSQLGQEKIWDCSFTQDLSGSF